MKVLTEGQLQEESDELRLKQALLADMREYVNRSDYTMDLIDDSIPQRVIDKAFRKKRVRQAVPRMAAGLLVILLLVSVTLPAGAQKPWLLQFFESRSGDAYYNPRVETDFDFSGICVPEKIPKDFLLSEYQWNAQKTSVHLEFNSEGGQYIQFFQSLSRHTAVADTENAELVEKVLINNSAGAHVIKNGIDTLYWNNGSFYFKLLGTIPYEKLREIADSVKEQNGE